MEGVVSGGEGFGEDRYVINTYMGVPYGWKIEPRTWWEVWKYKNKGGKLVGSE
jgi:hypothetical protein